MAYSDCNFTVYSDVCDAFVPLNWKYLIGSRNLLLRRYGLLRANSVYTVPPSLALSSYKNLNALSSASSTDFVQWTLMRLPIISGETLTSHEPFYTTLFDDRCRYLLAQRNSDMKSLASRHYISPFFSNDYNLYLISPFS